MMVRDGLVSCIIVGCQLARGAGVGPSEVGDAGLEVVHLYGGLGGFGAFIAEASTGTVYCILLGVNS